VQRLKPQELVEAAGRIISPRQAAVFDQLLYVSRAHHTNPKRAALARALADARAVDGEPWVWRIEVGMEPVMDAGSAYAGRVLG